LGGDIGIGSAGGISISALAARAAPPARKTSGNLIACAMVLILGGLFLLAFGIVGLSHPEDDPDLTARGPAITAVGVLLLTAAIVPIGFSIAAARWNARVYPILYSEWRSAWMCMRCGTEFLASRE
jgi:hypothetical protein